MWPGQSVDSGTVLQVSTLYKHLNNFNIVLAIFVQLKSYRPHPPTISNLEQLILKLNPSDESVLYGFIMVSLCFIHHT